MKDVTVAYKAKDDIPVIDPIQFQIEEKQRQRKQTKNSALAKIYAYRQFANLTEESKLKTESDKNLSISVEDDGADLFQRIQKDDFEFKKRVDGILQRNKTLPINKMFAVVHHLDHALQGLGETVDELDALKINPEITENLFTEEEFQRDLAMLASLKSSEIQTASVPLKTIIEKTNEAEVSKAEVPNKPQFDPSTNV